MNETDVTTADLNAIADDILAEQSDSDEPCREEPMALACDRDPYKDGREAMRQGIRPEGDEMVADEQFMRGWFYEWGYLDGSQGMTPLLDGHFLNADYMAGYFACTELIAGAKAVEPIADEAFNQFCVANGWDKGYIDENLRQVAQVDCTEDGAAYMFAQVEINEETGEEVLTQIIFRVEFKWEADDLKLLRCLDLRNPEAADYTYFVPEFPTIAAE